MVCCLLSVSRQSSTRGIRQRTSTATIADVVIGLSYGVVVNQGETLLTAFAIEQEFSGLQPHYIKIPRCRGNQCRNWHSGIKQQGEASRAASGNIGIKSAATAFYVRAQARGHCRCSRSDAANLAAGWVVDHFT